MQQYLEQQICSTCVLPKTRVPQAIGLRLLQALPSELPHHQVAIPPEQHQPRMRKSLKLLITQAHTQLQKELSGAAPVWIANGVFRTSCGKWPSQIAGVIYICLQHSNPILSSTSSNKQAMFSNNNMMQMRAKVLDAVCSQHRVGTDYDVSV